MTLETNVSPAEETQNPAAELTQDTPEVVTPENVEATEQETAPEKVEEDDREKERKRFQRRMDRRTAELYRERAEREALAARLAQYEQQKPQQEGERPQQADPYQIARQIAETERFTEKCNAIADEGGKKFKDFDVALRNLASEVGPLVNDKGGPTDLMEVVLEAEKPVALLHYLGTNPDVAAELADLSKTQLARRLDRIEREMAQAGKPQVSSAPRPLTPVTGSGSAVKDQGQMSDAEWRANRLAQK